MSSVLVTGATGKTGRHLVRELSDRGAAVRAAARRPDDVGAGVTAVRFDWTDPTTFPEAIEGSDAVYLVAVAGAFDAAPLVAPFLDALHARGIGRVVLLSSMGADQAPQFGTGLIERMLADGGFDWTVLAPNWFSQDFDQTLFLPMVRAGELRIPAGDGAVSWIDVRDIAAVAATALVEHGHTAQRYVLTGPEALTFDEVADVLTDVTGRRITYTDVPPDEMREAFVASGMNPQYAEMMLGVIVGIRAGAAAQVTDVVERVTGRPPVTFRDYAKDHADAWR